MTPTQEIQGYYFRIYTIEGCAHCKSVRDLFALHGVPLQEVVVDKLLEHAIPRTLNKEKIETPIVINHITGELCVGNHREIYLAWIRLYNSTFGCRFSYSPDERQHDNGSDTEKTFQ